MIQSDMIQKPEHLFTHDSCPGHIFNEKTLMYGGYVMNMRVCLLCFYTDGNSGFVDDNWVLGQE
jgi:hypothetical protein